MANDREVLREIWEGRLPVCFQLCADEVFELQQPDKFYLMLPRLSYFPILTDKIKKHFLRFVGQEKCDNEMWLESEGTPLKWHYPIGLLYDMMHPDASQDPTQLPWNITVHFDKFPEDVIIRCPNKEVVESHFMCSIKEADVLKHRGQVMSSMQKKDHNQLWLGLLNDKFDQFWAVNRRLMEVGEQENFKHIPVRVYQEYSMIQRLVKATTEGGGRATVANMMQQLFPNKPEVQVRTHGIHVPLDTPLQWMSEHMSYPDNFLHLCVS